MSPSLIREKDDWSIKNEAVRPYHQTDTDCLRHLQPALLHEKKEPVI